MTGPGGNLKTGRSETEKDQQGVRRVLLLVGYSYFFENFFSKIIEELHGEWTFDVWFDSNPQMFSQRDYEAALALAPYFGLGEIKRLPLSLYFDEKKLSNPKEFLIGSKSDVEALRDLASQRGYSAVITMNSALLTILPLVAAIKGLGLKLIVVRGTILEAPLLRLLRRFFPNVALSSGDIMRLKIGAVLGLYVTYLRRVGGLLAKLFRPNKTRHRQRRNIPKLMLLQEFLLGFLRLSPLSIGFFIRSLGVKKPVSAVLQTEFGVSNSDYTDYVVMPGTAHREHLNQLFPGPQYRSYSRFFDEVNGVRPEADSSINILLPLYSETSPEAIRLLEELFIHLIGIRKWSYVRYRMHPREEIRTPDQGLLGIIAKIPVPTANVSNLSFDDFSMLDGRFFVVGSSSAIISLSWFAPRAKIGVLSIDESHERGEDGRYLEGFGNAFLLRTSRDVEDWLRDSTSSSPEPCTGASLGQVLRDALESQRV